MVQFLPRQVLDSLGLLQGRSLPVRQVGPYRRHVQLAGASSTCGWLPMSDHIFIIGVNYWPQRRAMFMWRHFDPAAIREDIAGIAELGCSCVRIFLLWEDF